jgi:4-carboxymuconolactone decarboxylase
MGVQTCRMARIAPAALPDDLPVHNNLVRVTYHNPEMHRGFASLSGRVHTASSLEDRVRELVVLRIAAELGAAFEWASHVPGARRAGITDDEIRAMRVGDVSGLSPREAAAVRFAEAVERRTVDDRSWAAAAEHLRDDELLDLTLLVGFYGLASRLVLAMDITPDDGMGGLDQP